MEPLTKSQQKVYDFLRQEAPKGIPPTVREICAATGLRSTSTVHAHLRTLERLGYISRQAGHNRSIRIEGSENAAQVPILGKVTAGMPILAVEDIEGYLPFPEKPGKELFALHVSGLSMKNAGILDGDYVVAERASTAEDGDIVVAMIDEEAVKIKGKWSQGHCPGALPRLPAQLDRNPGPKNSQGKGLCDIVICAGFQPRHLVQFQIICSEQNHRRMVIPAAKAAQEIQPASVGEIDVQNQQIKPLIFQNLISLRKGRTAGDRPFRRFQRHGDSPAQYLIVFQKENVFHMVSSSANRMKPL